MAQDKLRQCRICKDWKPENTEHFHRLKGDQFHARCKECRWLIYHGFLVLIEFEETPQYKKCRKCREIKPNTLENFCTHNGMKDKLHYYCRDCMKVIRKERREPDRIRLQEWRRNNPDKVREYDSRRDPEKNRQYAREYYRNHREERREYNQRRYWANPEKERLYTRLWYRRNTEYAREAARQYYRENREKLKKYRYSYRRTESGKLSAQVSTTRRAARVKGLPDTLTPEQWKSALNYWGGKCAVCGKTPDFWTTLAQDHWIPVSKGGGTVPDNIIPLCHPKRDGEGGCNVRKKDRDAWEWLVSDFGEKKARAVLKRIEEYFEWIRNGGE